MKWVEVLIDVLQGIVCVVVCAFLVVCCAAVTWGVIRTVWYNPTLQDPPAKHEVVTRR